MEERPVWTRVALLNQLANDEERTFVNYSKEYLPLVAYTITDGAWKDTLVRFGYDVRDSPEARM
jgi:general transcription factor 3C polypeptide 5 (transcription factor C subunit 1)